MCVNEQILHIINFLFLLSIPKQDQEIFPYSCSGLSLPNRGHALAVPGTFMEFPCSLHPLVTFKWSPKSSCLFYGDNTCKSSARILNILNPDKAVRFINLKATLAKTKCGRPNIWLFDNEEFAILKIAILLDSNVWPVFNVLLISLNGVQPDDRIFRGNNGDSLSVHPGGSPPVFASRFHHHSSLTSHLSKTTIAQPLASIFPLVLSHGLLVVPLHLNKCVKQVYWRS